jgi:hypothetical protein
MDITRDRRGRKPKYDDIHHLRRSYRQTIYYYLKGNTNSLLARTLLGCDRKSFFKRMGKKLRGFEKKWKAGKYEIDHIIPISEFDLHKKNELLTCFSVENVQPLTKSDNCRKKDGKWIHYILPVDCLTI